MEKKRMIYEIKSKYIIKHIYNYIQDKHFALKLFFYSKYFQIRLDINYSYCYKKYLDEMQFQLCDYLHCRYMYKKDLLRTKYDNFLLENKLNKEEFEHIIYEIESNQNEIDKTDKKYIDLNSPLFEMLSKINDFDKFFTIYIPQEDIDKNKLKDDYKSIFNELNESNIKYSSICYIPNKKTKMNFLKKLNIIMEKIKNMIFVYNGNKINDDNYSNDGKNILNCFINLEELIVRGNKNLITFLENINLKKLKILDCSYNNTLDIKVLEKTKLCNLEILNLSNNNLSNIDFLENVNFKELKELNLTKNKILDIKVLEK